MRNLFQLSVVAIFQSSRHLDFVSSQTLGSPGTYSNAVKQSAKPKQSHLPPYLIPINPPAKEMSDISVRPL
jgi:hypothetical protein